MMITSSIKLVPVFALNLPVPTSPAIKTEFSGVKDMISGQEPEAGKAFTAPANKVFFEYNQNTRELTIPDELKDFAAFGNYVEVEPDLFYRMTAYKGVWYADPQEVFQAKIWVQEDGFEVVKDDETDCWRWSARNWVEQSGLYDTDDEAYIGCVEINHIHW
jgi:hypothetical protein